MLLDETLISRFKSITMDKISLQHKALKPIQTSRDREALGRNAVVEAEPLSPMARLFHEPGSNVYIIGILGSKTKLYPEVAKTQLVDGLLKHPRFSSLQVLDEVDGRIKWVPTKVDLRDHVVVPEVEPNIESPDQFVEDYIFNLSKTSLDKTKPLWDLHLLDLKTSESEGVIVYRVHHSIGDGMSLMSLLLACSRKVSDPAALPSIPQVTKKSSSSKKLGLQAILRLIWNTITGVFLFLATALFLKDTKTPLKGRPGVENNPRRVIKRTVSMDDVKLVKKAMKNVTINDVVLGVTQVGLSRYLNRRYGESKNSKEPMEEKNYIPKNIRLRSTFFVNIRPSAGIQDLAAMMEKGSPAKWGNKIGYVILPFTIGFQEDPLDYIRLAKVAIDRKKASLEPLCSYFFAKFLSMFFGDKITGLFNYKIFANTTLWFSNVPGTEDEIAYCGHEISYYAPTCFGQPNALMIHVVSYVDKLIFIISADDETIPDPHRLCDDLEESLKLIKDTVQAAKQGT